MGIKQDKHQDYQTFVEKFKPKKTTDDCYTPPLIYEAVADYVAEHYKVDKNNFVRPFVPGGDYQSENYKKTDIVVDNPPFSIFSEILRFYTENNIKFFLFAPHLTFFSSYGTGSWSGIICGNSLTYENGAKVPTSFATNLETCAFRSAPDLYEALEKADERVRRKDKKRLPKYIYPQNVITSAMILGYAQHGVNFEVGKNECFFIRSLDAQKEKGKQLFGAGFLISERAAAERAAAERAAAEVWELSGREKEIIQGLK